MNAWKPLAEFKCIAKAKMQQILKGSAKSISKLPEMNTRENSVEWLI